MSKCYICDCDINKDNETEEHIFLNSIGGKLKSKNLICSTCNSEFGESIDAALSKQFNCFANMLNIERDRGEPQPFKVIDKENGEVYSYEPGGKPVILKPQIQKKGDYYNIVARDRKQAKEILKGLKRKHPQINVEEVLSNLETKKEYMDSSVSFKICLGGDKEFRALCKMAVNFYLYSGGEQEYIKHVIPYLKGEWNLDRKVSPAYFSNKLVKKNKEDILHSIIVIGKKNEKILYGYIELFNFYKVIILLNDNYAGNNIEYSYFFDVISRNEVQREYKVNISRNEINEMLNQTNFQINEMVMEMNQLMKKIYNKQNKDQINNFLDTALNNSLKKYTEGIPITEEMYEELIKETIKEITPWILHNYKK